MQLMPFLLFDGCCAEAMEFYRSCLGGELRVTRMGETPMAAGAPDEQRDKVVYAHLRSGALEISATDWLHPTRRPNPGNMVALYLTGRGYDELQRPFERLAQVESPNCWTNCARSRSASTDIWPTVTECTGSFVATRKDQEPPERAGTGHGSSAVVEWVGCSLLLVSGSLRQASTNSAVLRTVRADAARGTECILYEELAGLPHFNPDDDHGTPPAAVARLRTAVQRADALLFSTPEYTGAMPGALKNLLEWLIGDDQPGSIYEKPVSWINTSPRGAQLAHESLHAVLGYAHARLVEEACGRVPVTATSVGGDGLLSDAVARADVSRLATALAAAGRAASAALVMPRRSELLRLRRERPRPRRGS